MITDEIKSIIPVEKLYQDALSPAMKQIGAILESVTKTSRFLFAPFEFMAAYHDRWEKYLIKVSERVDEDNLIEGQPQVVIPTMEGLSLAPEDSLLSELFINLLSNSIDKNKQDLAHPAFPNIIRQMSHDEAVMIYFLKKNVRIERHKHEEDTNENTNLSYYVGANEILSFPMHFDLYKEHLRSLTLLKPSRSTNHFGMKGIILDNNRGGNEAGLSNFGLLFAQSCVPDTFQDMKF